MSLSGYIRTYNNHRFFFEHPEESVIDPEDISHSLSNQCRWTGHTKRFYSIGQHSCHCHDFVDEPFKFEALMHDASEAYLVDLSRPLKQFVPDYKEIQKRIEKFLAEYYELPYPMSEPVRLIDDRMLVTEWNQLFDKRTSIGLSVKEEPIDFNIPYWTPDKTEKEFNERFYSYV